MKFQTECVEFLDCICREHSHFLSHCRNYMHPMDEWTRFAKSMLKNCTCYFENAQTTEGTLTNTFVQPKKLFRAYYDFVQFEHERIQPA